jgi:hypothetical protein
MMQQPTMEETDTLLEEIFYVVDGEECYLFRGNEGDCVRDELEVQLLDAGNAGFNISLASTTKKANKWAPAILVIVGTLGTPGHIHINQKPIEIPKSVE